jgi:hypothetical protein
MSAVVLSGGHILGNSGGVFNVSAAGYDGVITVNGGAFNNGAGAVQQLRGVNIQGQPEYMIVSAQTIASTGVNDCSGGSLLNDQVATVTGSGASTALVNAGPITSYMQNWKINAVRVGINEASWLGYTCYEPGGTAINPDNYGSYPLLSYQNQIIHQVAALNAAGFYVILTLAWTNPGRCTPLQQDIMANQDNSIQCWQSIAGVFGYPNGTALKQNGGTVDNRAVIFELFNEPKEFETQTYQGGFVNSYYQYNNGATAIYPFPCNVPTGSFTPGEAVTISGGITGNILCYYLNTTTGLASSGTTFVHLYNLSSTSISNGATITGNSSAAHTTTTSATYGWYVAGNQQMLSAIRTAGAGNVVLCSGTDFSKYLNNWLTYMSGMDNTAPTGWSGGWTSQLGAHWHPYPVTNGVTAVTVQSGGTGYSSGDTILLYMPEDDQYNVTDPYSGCCYYQTQVTVGSGNVSGGILSGTLTLDTGYTGGTPGKSGGGNGQITVSGGAWCNAALPSNPVSQQSTSGSGSGATFNLTFSGPSDSNTIQSNWTVLTNIVSNGYPVCITETGEHTGGDGNSSYTNIQGSPWMKALTAWCDTNGVSLVCFAYLPTTNGSWYNVAGYDYTLCYAGSATPHNPSFGYGQFMYNWFTNHAP